MSSSASGSGTKKRSKSKSSGGGGGSDNGPTYKYMITEAIWAEKHYMKGSSTADIMKWIEDKYDIEEKDLKPHLKSTISKMLKEGDAGYALLKKVDDNYKLTTEWRRAWTKKYNKKSERKKRKKKPEGYPKRARNAYLFYVQDVRKKRQKEHPNKSMPELTKLIGAEWQELSDSKKKEISRYGGQG